MIRVARQVDAARAARRLSAAELAQLADMPPHLLRRRLRAEAPFRVDELELVTTILGIVVTLPIEAQVQSGEQHEKSIDPMPAAKASQPTR